MEQKKVQSTTKREARTLRKKIKQVENSRSSIKVKSRNKGVAIKKLKDRQKELEDSRDHWKEEHAELNKQHAYLASLFEMKEEQFRQILKEFEDYKKNAATKRTNNRRS